MDGKALAERIRADVAREIAELGHVGARDGAGGRRPASDVPIRLKQARRGGGRDRRAGHQAHGRDHRADVLALVDELNGDDGVDGVLVRSRSRRTSTRTKVTYAVAPHGTWTGSHPVNAGISTSAPRYTFRQLRRGAWRCSGYGVDPKGRNAVVIGRAGSSGGRRRCCSSGPTRRSRSATRGRSTSRPSASRRHRRRGGGRPRDRLPGW
jgi:methylenetetrahydrofolate dehydrogenase (NADP+)/methenyltetrahydrofolate cyclohydrolase